jgi:predicted amidohydrolase YtcJ
MVAAMRRDANLFSSSTRSSILAGRSSLSSLAALTALAILTACSGAPSAGGGSAGGGSAGSGSSTPPAGDPVPPAPVHELAELVLRGGDVHTMDAARPRASAVAIRAGVIAAVGSDDEIAAWIGPSTEVVELAGRSVTPGLVDAHCHVFGLAADLQRVSVRNLTSEEAVAQVIAQAATGRATEEWLLGRGWDQNRWPGQRFPTRASLDAVVGDRPVALERIDGHALWLSSAALARAGITARTPDPAGGKIVRDARGQPTGVLIDNATALAEKAIPSPSAEVRERWLRQALAVVSSLGLTGAHEMGIDEETAAVYRKLAAANELPVRIHAFASAPADAEVLHGVPPQPAIGRFVMRGVKFYADGALGSRGARLYADYSDDRGNRGLWVTKPEALTRGVEAALGGGWQVAVHAIGDAGVGAVLDAFAAANKIHPGDHRLRIEHAQIVAPRDLERMERMTGAGVIASMQPTHATSDMPWAEARIGAKRITGAYAWRSMLDRKIPLAAGSDFPVEEPSPLLGIYAAVTRQDAQGAPAGGWTPAQRLTLDEAIAAFTSGAAFAEGAEGRRGMIAVGKDADVTVFDRPLTPDRQLLTTAILMTIVEGRVAYRKPRR